MNSVFDDPDKVDLSEDPAIHKANLHFGKMLKEARETRELSQQKLSDLSGVGQKLISQIERGDNFRFDTYSKACKGMGLSPRVELKAIRFLREDTVHDSRTNNKNEQI